MPHYDQANQITGKFSNHIPTEPIYSPPPFGNPTSKPLIPQVLSAWQKAQIITNICPFALLQQEDKGYYQHY